MWVKESSYQFDKIYAYNMRTRAHDPNKDFNTLKAAGEQDTDGIWSDGTTMFVADGYRHKIYAYNMRSKARDKGQDFDLAAGNTYPTGIWSGRNDCVGGGLQGPHLCLRRPGHHQ